MFCHRCGSEIPEGAAFCSSCGQDLNATTPMTAIRDLVQPTDTEIVREALKEEYEIKSELGRGGMGIVYRAMETGLNREVAIKVLPISHTHDTNLVERFEMEARTAARLEHPHIIPIYRVGRSGRVIYFAMRYLGGPSLSELIAEHGALPPDRIRRILLQSADALGYAHRHGIVHRDVKPDNIMFKQNGDIVMCDFGIAKAASGLGLTGTGMAIGTPYYMSPEQIRANKLDGRSDLYSLGVVAYQCLTTHVPFDGEDSYGIGLKHIMDDVPVPELKTDEHRALFTVIERLLAKHPGDRYPDADALIEALEKDRPTIAAAAIGDRTVASPVLSTSAPAATGASPRQIGNRPSAVTPTTPLPRITIENDTQRSRPRRRLAVAASLLVVLTGAGGGGGYYWRQVLHRPWPTRNDVTALAAAVPVFRYPAAMAVAGPAPLVNLPATDSLAVDSVTAVDSTAVDTSSAPADSVAAAPVDGVLRVGNMGRRAKLWIDGRTARGLVHTLPPGAHRIRVEAPGYEPYTAVVTVPAGDSLRHRVRMRRESQCARYDAETYNLRGECFDTGARLLPELSTMVPLDGTVPRAPTRPALLVVEVYPDGRPGQIMIKSPSDVPEFAVLAVNYAKTLQFEPAVRRGQPIKAWIQLPLYPQR